MIRFAIATLLAVILGAAMALAPIEKREKEAKMRRIATEAACRTIVEAKLVRSCTLRQ